MSLIDLGLLPSRLTSRWTRLPRQMPWKTLSYPVKSPSLLLICRQTGLVLSFRSLLIVRHFCEIFPLHFSGQSRLDGPLPHVHILALSIDLVWYWYCAALESGVMFYSGNFISADSARKKIHGGSGEVGKGDGYKPGGQWSSLHHHQSPLPLFHGD